MHPESELIAFVRGDLPPADRARVTAHLDGCAECRRAADESRAVLDALTAGAPTPPRSARA
jgi:anti-sigma factor RsiW